MMNESGFVTLLVVDVFDSLDISYPIGGSFASTAYGHIRTTQAVDFVAAIELNHVDAFVGALKSSFYVDKDMINNAIANRTNFNLIHLETMFEVDIFLPEDRRFDHQQLARRVKRVIDKDLGR